MASSWLPACADTGAPAVLRVLTSSATPEKPTNSPNSRHLPGFCPSQSQATQAVNSGVVALRMDDNPVEILSSANEKQANGMPALKMPTTAITRQCRHIAPACPRSTTSGKSSAAAMPTRMAAVAMAPNSGPATCMKRKDAPHTADMTKKSICHG